jgi:hypothetical protein
VNIVQILCTHVCKWKMIPIEATPEIGGGEDKGEWFWGLNSTVTYLVYFKNFCKCHKPHLTQQ